MKQLNMFAAAFTLAVLAVGMFARVPSAQTPVAVYEACKPGKAEIRANDLPTVVDQERCPVAGRTIVDSGGIGSVLPPPGMGVYAAFHTPDGAQELTIMNPRDGTFVLQQVGSELSAQVAGTITAQGTDPKGCDDPAHKPDPANTGRRLYSNHHWWVNGGSTPTNMTVADAETAIFRAGANITNVDNPCGVPDGVAIGMTYEGRTSTSVNITRDAKCGPYDGKSVVGFGDLPINYLAGECHDVSIRDGQDEVIESDTRMNKADYKWTTEGGASGCSGKYDVEAVMTHERGHTLGMYHVDEDLHPYLTMSEASNGTCQTSERSLGQGDAEGLNEKYP